MFFTQEDFKRIHNWLKIHGKKDSSLELADNFKGNEELAIIQDNKNKRLSIKTLTQELYDSSVGGVLNISDKYKKKNITLNEAVSLINTELRKEGQFISFLDINNNWKLFQFKHEDISEWENIKYWEDFNINQHIDSILPDEEDLTKIEEGKNYILKFKDKINKSEFGLSVVMCRANALEIKLPNTIYIIRYNYNLRGTSLILPKNSYLYILGGSLTNGTIVGNNTKLIFRDKCAFSNIKFKGTWDSTLYTIYDNEINSVDLNDLKYQVENNVLTEEAVKMYHLSEEVKDWIKTATIFVDGEDLYRASSGEILFADKEYSKELFSGMGRKYIRNNIIDGENILRQNVFNSENTIYIIQNDFTLLGGKISIPDNSIIINKGGSIKEGTIIFSKNNILIDLGDFFTSAINVDGEYQTLSMMNMIGIQQDFNSIINKNEW